ncbi:MAG: response regulator [Desulfosarcina sp.]
MRLQRREMFDCPTPDAAAIPRRKQVLVVDDDATILDLLATFLTRLGYDVWRAADGSIALDLFRRISFDLVITDLAMPVMDGYTLCTKISGLAATTPVVVVTGRVDFTPEQAACLTTAVEVMVKPFDLKRLKAVVEGALATRLKAASI